MRIQTGILMSPASVSSMKTKMRSWRRRALSSSGGSSGKDIGHGGGSSSDGGRSSQEAIEMEDPVQGKEVASPALDAAAAALGSGPSAWPKALKFGELSPSPSAMVDNGRGGSEPPPVDMEAALPAPGAGGAKEAVAVKGPVVAAKEAVGAGDCRP